MKLSNTLKEKALNYAFIVSKQPVLYRDLLRANALYNEGMHIDPAVLNFRINLGNSYLLYTLLCAIVLIPLIFATHTIFVNIDLHISILGAIFTTSCVFLGFQIFQDWLRASITLKLIKRAWHMHFPHFPYEKYNQKVEALYGEILKNEIPKKDWERYILDRLVNIA